MHEHQLFVLLHCTYRLPTNTHSYTQFRSFIYKLNKLATFSFYLNLLISIIFSLNTIFIHLILWIILVNAWTWQQWRWRWRRYIAFKSNGCIYVCFSHRLNSITTVKKERKVHCTLYIKSKQIKYTHTPCHTTNYAIM